MQKPAGGEGDATLNAAAPGESHASRGFLAGESPKRGWTGLVLQESCPAEPGKPQDSD